MGGLSRRGVLRAGLAATAVAGGVAATERVEAGHALGPMDVLAATGGGWISVLDHGARGDGQADDRAAIQAAIDTARAAGNGTGIDLPPGIYKVSGGLVAQGLSDFVISGQGATLMLADAAVGAPRGGTSILQLTDCHGFAVLGLAVRDADRRQTYSGLGVARSSGGTIHGVHVRDVRWTGISVFDTSPQASSDIDITCCTVEGTRFGISSNGKDVRIADNHVAMDWPSTDEARAKGGVWSEPSDYYDGIMILDGADRTVVTGNTVTECGQAGIYTQACTNAVIADNTVTGCQLRGIEVDGDAGTAVGVTVSGNVVSNCVGHINLVKARDVTVVGNRTENPNSGRAVSCIAVNTGTNRVVVVGNHATQAHPSFPAVYVDPAARDVTVAWNAVNAGTAYQAPADTVTIHRSGPGQITTAAKLIAVGGIGVGNSAPARSVGSIVRKIEVFSSTGTSLGWIPVYGTIT